MHLVLGDRTLAYISLLAAVPTTLTWSPKVAVVMVLCNVLAIAIGKYTIKYPSAGPALPSPTLFGGMGLGALLGTTSLGHLLGAGVILGLASIGAI
ncbi:MAG: photosystem I reaction center subunit PsaK [Leptolyngbya sp. SIO1E4]|nr:photosystem I reaction center subunit PsaK [Leptolyngbya sp. SIO1E4]